MGSTRPPVKSGGPVPAAFPYPPIAVPPVGVPHPWLDSIFACSEGTVAVSAICWPATTGTELKLVSFAPFNVIVGTAFCIAFVWALVGPLVGGCPAWPPLNAWLPYPLFVTVTLTLSVGVFAGTYMSTMITLSVYWYHCRTVIGTEKPSPGRLVPKCCPLIVRWTVVSAFHTLGEIDEITGL